MEQAKRPYRKHGKDPAWERDRFCQAVASNYSIGGVLAQLGLGVPGWNYRWVHRLIDEYGLDTAHWLGQAYLRGKRNTWAPNIPLDEILVERSVFTNSTQLKQRLRSVGLLVDVCAICGISTWLGCRLVLQLDHIDGVGDDHRIENLRLLCPNCHSQTETYCGRNIAAGRRGRWAGSQATPLSG